MNLAFDVGKTEIKASRFTAQH